MKLFEHVYLVKQIIDNTTVMQYISAYSTSASRQQIVLTIVSSLCDNY